MSEVWKCDICGGDGYKTDGECNVWCEKCLDIGTKNRYTYKRTENKIGRNEPCPCGSGKKYKRCCALANER